MDGAKEHDEYGRGKKEAKAGKNGFRAVSPGNRKEIKNKADGMFGLGSGKSIVGLDIGSSSIKAIELKRSKGEIVVTHLGVEPLASDIVVDSMIVDSGAGCPTTNPGPSSS